MMDPIENFLSAMRSAFSPFGIKPPAEIQQDGITHRFSTNCRSDDDSGWYIYVPRGAETCGAFGCRRSGITQEWHIDPDDTSRVLTSSQEFEGRFIRLAEDPASVPAPANEWLIEGWQPRGIGFTYGTTGYLKSFAELWQAISSAAGRAMFGHKVATKSGVVRSLIFHSEDSADRLEYDLNRMAARMDLNRDEISAVRENLRVIAVPDIDMSFGYREMGTIKRSPAIGWIAETAYDFRADLIILDTMSGMEPGGGDFGEKAMTILRGFYSIMGIVGCGIHALAHVSKEVSRNDLRDVGSILGSSQYGNKCRIARWVARPTADEMASAPQSIRDMMERCNFHGDTPAISIMGVSKISHAAPIDSVIWLGRSNTGIVVESVAGGSTEERHRTVMDARRDRAKDVVLKILKEYPNGISSGSLDTLAMQAGCGRNMARLMFEELVSHGRATQVSGPSKENGGRRSILCKLC